MTVAPLMRQVLALMLGTAAGYAAWRAGIPLPWMIGPMIVNTLAALGHLPVAAPLRLRPVVIPVIGVMLGSAITAEVFAHLGDWVITLAGMIPFLAVAALASMTIYRRVGKLDPVTAYFAAMPGGLNEMLLLGTAAGGVERRIAMAHATRILVVISCVGIFFGLVLGVRTSGTGGRPWLPMSAVGLADWLALGACAVAGVPLAKVLRLPAGNVLGPMILSGVAHMTHLVDIPPPSLIVNGAQIVLGTVIGCRFLGATLSEVGRDLMLGVLSSLAMLAVAVAFASSVAWLTQTPATQVFLAYSPGGLTEMSLLALALHQDVAFVSVMHILRILVVIVAAPLVFRRMR
jgi:membrane AbrB-like protein